MNGGYVILNSPYVDELFRKLAMQEKTFSINGLYNYLDSIFKLGKAIITNPKSLKSTSIIFNNITKVHDVSSYSISAIVGYVVATVNINSDDSCNAKYITIGG